MRFSVTLRMQNASFRRMRFYSPGQTWRHLTERRTLGPPPHGKAHFAGVTLTEKHSLGDSAIAECAFPSRRGAWEVWGNPPPGCGALWRMPQLGKCARATPRQAAGRVARGFANLGLEFGLTEKCTLKPTGWAECTFPSRRPPRVRFSVTLRMQNASFRRMRFSSPGQTWRHLTERRTLELAPHEKAQSGPAASRKSAFWG